MEDKNRGKKNQETKLFPELQKYVPRPASSDEAGLFYASTQEQDAELGCIGNVRMDFGSGREFWHTWWPRGDESLNSPEFKKELSEVVDTLRKSVLKDLSSMYSYCCNHGGKLGHDSVQYGYIVETPNYRYCLRCNSQRGDYNAYLACFDLRVQRQQQAEKPTVGRVSFASGEEITYTDSEEYLKAIREELPYHATSGFRYQTITDDPQVRKAVDDEIYNLFGEINPRSLEEYEISPVQGMTLGGM